MAPDDFWSRKRREEEKEQREAEERADEEARKKKHASTTAPGRAASTDSSGALSFDELLRRATVLIDQLEHLYRQFTVGILARPPVEERARLDGMITQMTHATKGSTADRFKFSGVLQSYNTHKQRWDKLLADVESGKIKRVAGPKKH
ncbi:MAG: hypothetical protein ACJ763_05995 [Bdellovibrionia bacterium]